MKTIWKFTLDPFDPVIEMPKGAKVIHVHEQNQKVRLWAEIATDMPQEKRTFAPVMTGGAMPENGTYIGSAHITEDGLMIVVYVYDVTPVAAPVSFKEVAAVSASECKHHGAWS
jgi:hypothetical protein